MEKKALGRQLSSTSIYSLTLDEFKHLMKESGKNFGSMNMDEFLTSVWNADQDQTGTVTGPPPVVLHLNTTSNLKPDHAASDAATPPHNIVGITSLPCSQSSLTIPAPLCRKTVDEVWSEIHSGWHHQEQTTAARQPAFGEMTLEDFLVKAGIVREQQATACIELPHHDDDEFGSKGTGDQLAAGNDVCYKEAAAAAPPPPSPVVQMGMTMSPVTISEPDDADCSYVGVGFRLGRKRILDGPVEKVVERRQRRMIKNRESAARSRARKLAYTVELEAELNQLKEENSQLRQTLAELERRRKQQLFEELNVLTAQTEAQKAREKLKKLWRAISCPF